MNKKEQPLSMNDIMNPCAMCKCGGAYYHITIDDMLEVIKVRVCAECEYKVVNFMQKQSLKATKRKVYK